MLEEVREIRLTVRVTRDEHAALRRAAARRGVSTAAFLRLRGLECEPTKGEQETAERRLPIER